MFYSHALLVALLIRIASAASVFWLYPFPAAVVNHLAENHDFIAWRLDPRDPSQLEYDQWDKLGDAVCYAASLAFYWRFRRELWFASRLLPPLVLRLAGTAVFYATHNYNVFAVFPDLFTYPNALFALLHALGHDDALRRRPGAQVVVLSALSLWKLVEEMLHHAPRFRLAIVQYVRLRQDPPRSALQELLIHHIGWSLPFVVAAIVLAVVWDRAFPDRRLRRGRYLQFTPLQ